MRHLSFLAAVAGVAALAVSLNPATAQPPADGKWAAIKGQVVFPEKLPVPVRAPLNVTQDKAHCLSKGPILDEAPLVNPKSKGIRNVVVYLRPDNADPKMVKVGLPKDKIHPDDAKRKAADVVIDQPVCMFTPRVTVARVGDTIVAKNSAPVAHNFKWSSLSNGEHNPIIPPNGDFKVGPLVAESGPIQYSCTIHPWMIGWVRVFDHPYYAATDEDGKFEIKNAPVGKYRLVYWHETVGNKGGVPGRYGTPVEVKADGVDVGKVEFDITPKK